jgi:nucleoside-diphosphate-sugar epimerase
MYVVTGATGDVGGELVRLLATAGSGSPRSPRGQGLGRVPSTFAAWATRNIAAFR